MCHLDRLKAIGIQVWLTCSTCLEKEMHFQETHFLIRTYTHTHAHTHAYTHTHTHTHARMYIIYFTSGFNHTILAVWMRFKSIKMQNAILKMCVYLCACVCECVYGCVCVGRWVGGGRGKEYLKILTLLFTTGELLFTIEEYCYVLVLNFLF